MPNAADAGRIVGTGDNLVLPVLRFFTYSPDDFYAQLEAFGPAGRAAFVDYRIVKDTLWLITLGAFLALATGALLRATTAPGSRQRLLNAVAPFPSLLDFLENQLQNLLVLLYPDRHDDLAILAATLTAAKWITLAAAFLVLLYALLRMAAGYRRRLAPAHRPAVDARHDESPGEHND